MINAFANHFDEARNCYRTAIAKRKAISVCDEVINDILDKIDADTKVSPPLFASRPMTIGGSSIFRDPNYDCDGNPIATAICDVTEEDYDEKDARELRTNKWDKIEFDWQIWTTPREYHEVIEGHPYLPPVEDLKPPKGLKRHVAEVLYDEEEKEERKSVCRCILM